MTEVIKKPYKRQIAVTFDDGLRDVYDIAYPFLKQRNIPFTIFIVTDFLDKEGYITTENLKEMAKDSLITIGSHGVTHKTLNTLSEAEQKRELSKSQKTLEEITGKSINFFAFSHGQYNKNTLKLMRNYDYALSTRHLPLNFITEFNRKALPRFNVDSNSFDNVKAELLEMFKK